MLKYMRKNLLLRIIIKIKNIFFYYIMQRCKNKITLNIYFIYYIFNDFIVYIISYNVI